MGHASAGGGASRACTTVTVRRCRRRIGHAPVRIHRSRMTDGGTCTRCGRFRAFGRKPPHVETDRLLATIPVGHRDPAVYALAERAWRLARAGGRTLSLERALVIAILVLLLIFVATRLF